MSKCTNAATARAHAVVGQFSVSVGLREGPGSPPLCYLRYALDGGRVLKLEFKSMSSKY